MKTKKFATIFVGAFVFLFGIVLSVYAAWGYGGSEAPYQGSYTYWHNSGGTGAGSLTSYAYNMKWTQSAINDMKWDGNSEYLDQTVDCTVNSTGNDRLHATSSSTNVPNYGYFIYNDTQPSEFCGSSSNSVKEEIELKINPYSLSSIVTYWQSVNWDCAYGGASGEINVSFEPAWWAHEWLDKVNYWCYGSSQITGNEPNFEGKPFSNNEPQLVREVNNGVFSYQVIRTASDQIRVYSDVNFLDEQILKAYQAENELQFHIALSEKTTNDVSLVVVTFASPLSVPEAKSLTQNAQMDVVSYGIFGRLEDEVVSTYVFPPSLAIDDFIQDKIATENIGKITYDGIMTITGFVDRSGLQTLNTYPSVALLDLTANRIQLELNDLKETIELKQFAIPNPAWYIFTGELVVTE